MSENQTNLHVGGRRGTVFLFNTVQQDYETLYYSRAITLVIIFFGKELNTVKFHALALNPSEF
jgi:hypothetical protein